MEKIDKIVESVAFAGVVVSTLTLGHLSATWRKRTFDDVPANKRGRKTTLAYIKFALTDVRDEVIDYLFH